MRAYRYDSANFVSVHREENGRQTSDLALRVGWLSASESDTRQRKFLGILLKIPDQILLSSIRLASVLQDGNRDHFLVAEVGGAQQKAAFIALPLVEKEFSRGKIQLFPSRDECFRALYKVKAREAENIPDVFLYRNGVSGQMFVFAPDGRLLGVSAHRTAIADAQYNLQPDYYIPGQQTVEREESVSIILSEIKRQQYVIVQYADNLLGRAETKPLVGEQLPPCITSTEGFSLLSSLNTEQEHIWKHILGYKTHQSKYALYFTSQQLYDELRESEVDFITIQQTLDVLIRLGLIVQVIVHDPNTNIAGRYCRLATEQDNPALV